MKRFAIAAAVAASLAAPAFAQDTTSFAIMHFNMDADSAGDVRMVPQTLRTIELTPGSTIGDVISHLDMDADSFMDVSGDTGGVTILSSSPAHAAEIFARLMEESREDE